MTYARRLTRSSLTAMLGLVLVATLIGGAIAVQAQSAESPMLPAWSWAQLGFVYTLIIGTLPVLLYGAPCYALLAGRGLATWRNSLLLGVAPGLAAVLIDRELAMWAVVCGAAVAAFTHAILRERAARSDRNDQNDRNDRAMLTPPTTP